MTAYTPVQCQSCGHPVPDETCPGSTDAEVGLTEELRVQKRALACVKAPPAERKQGLRSARGPSGTGGRNARRGLYSPEARPALREAALTRS